MRVWGSRARHPGFWPGLRGDLGAVPWERGDSEAGFGCERAGHRETAPRDSREGVALRAGGQVCMWSPPKAAGPSEVTQRGRGRWEGRGGLVTLEGLRHPGAGRRSSVAEGGGAAGRRRSPRGCSEGQRKLRGEGAGVVAADREAGRESPVSAAHGHRCASEPRLLPRHVCWNLLEAPNHPALLTVRSTQRGILPCAKTLFFVVLEPFSPRDTLGMQLQCLSGSGTS